MGQKIQRECPSCGIVYTADTVRLRHGRGTTCSRFCSYRLRGDHQRKQVDLVCGTCGREFHRAPSTIKGKHGADFCSPECHYRGRTLGVSRRVVTEPYTYTSNGRRKLSEAGALAYAAGNTLPRPQSELNVLAALAETGERVTYQHIVKGESRTYVVDFYLPDRGVVIEIDGPEHRRQAAVDRDAAVDEVLAGLGVRVVRVPLLPPDDLRQAVLAALAGG